jgi:uncharacterized protein YdeI (YjbR/CyaY-like superfamily)
MDAKRAETRQKRIEKTLMMLKANQRLGVDTRLTDKRDA